VFVRLQGCTVGCAWCDTKYSWDADGGTPMELDAILRRVGEAGPEGSNVVITGGEPLEHPAFEPLVHGVKSLGARIEVETAGVRAPPAVPVDQWNVSLKLAHSGVAPARRLCAEAVERFRDLGAWFKFVVGDEADVAQVVAIQSAHGIPAAQILLMPLGIKRAEQLERMPRVAEWCRRHGYRLSPRLHILMWGPRRGI
jgi:7-carboxy-7-deazaguanine synthase